MPSQSHYSNTYGYGYGSYSFACFSDRTWCRQQDRSMIQELLCGGGLLLEERRNRISSTPTVLLPPPDGLSNNHSNSSTPATTPPHSATSSPNGSTAAHEHQNLRCPRCDSSNTKFCYYNNYNLTQPRHFCKTCRRYWTKGGALRNVPIGGGCRKTKAVGLSIANKSGSGGNCKANGVVTRPNPTQIPWSSMPTSTPNINSQLIASLVRPSSGYTNPFLAKPINQNSTPISSHPLPSYDSSSPTTIMKNSSITSKLFGLDQNNYSIPTGVCGSLWNNTAQYSNNSNNYYHQQVSPAASRIHHLYQMLKSNSNAAAADHQNQMLATTTVTSAAAQASSILDNTADHHQDGVGASELWNNWNQLPSLYWSDMPPASNANGVALP